MFVMDKEKSHEVERKTRVRECLRARYLFFEKRVGSQEVRMPPLAPSNPINSMVER